MRYWWCNQSECFELEYEEGVVQASDQMNSSSGLRYRKTVAGVLKGDIVLHYHKRRGIVAISKAEEDASGPVKLKNLGGEYYESGWRFKTNYNVLTKPIPKSDWILSLIPDRNDPEWPVNSNGNIKQAYFIPFSLQGYREVMEHCDEKLPSWAKR